MAVVPSAAAPATAYRPLVPAGPVARAVLCRWDATFAGDHTLVPDGCVELMWLEGRGVVICGPETTPWSFHFDSARAAGGIRLRPGVAEPMFGIDVSTISNQVVELAAVVGDRTARRIATPIDAGAQPSGVLLAAVERWRDRTEPAPAVRALRRGGALGVLAADLGCSSRTLHRVARRAFGYPPTVFNAIARVQRFLELARRMPAAPLGLLAAAAGFADQPHLTRECRRWSGMTPTMLLQAPAATWHGDGALAAAPTV